MDEIKYKIINRGKLELILGERTMILHGELIFDPPMFYVSTSTIRNWEPPFGKENISDGEKYRIILALLNESRKEGNVNLVFD